MALWQPAGQGVLGLTFGRLGNDDRAFDRLLLEQDFQALLGQEFHRLERIRPVIPQLATTVRSPT